MGRRLQLREIASRRRVLEGVGVDYWEGGCLGV